MPQERQKSGGYFQQKSYQKHILLALGNSLKTSAVIRSLYFPKVFIWMNNNISAVSLKIHEKVYKIIKFYFIASFSSYQKRFDIS